MAASGAAVAPVADAAMLGKLLELGHSRDLHRSASISYDDVFKLAAVRPDQLRSSFSAHP